MAILGAHEYIRSENIGVLAVAMIRSLAEVGILKLTGYVNSIHIILIKWSGLEVSSGILHTIVSSPMVPR